MQFQGIEICCPRCQGNLHEAGVQEQLFTCLACDAAYPVILGIPDLRIFPDPYIDFDTDRAKGRRIAERFDDLDFGELIDFYYSITAVVPPKHAQQYKRGLLAGAHRSSAALQAWENYASPPTSATLLDLGCGTAPLLVAAAGQYRQMIGVDIAFRWLVMAKKRLAEAGSSVPLICACAEALPFPDRQFDRVTAESVLETVSDQTKTLTECYRVIRPGGAMFIATPNKYSLGPDPHTGLLAGGYLPETWVASYVRRQGGIPPQRQLLAAGSLLSYLQTAGFSPTSIFLPTIASAQRAQFGSMMRLLIDMYHLAIRLPLSSIFMRWIGPLLYTVSQKR